MKKLTAFVLSAMMVLSLAACGSSKAETPAEDTSTPAEDTAPAEDAKLRMLLEQYKYTYEQMSDMLRRLSSY